VAHSFAILVRKLLIIVGLLVFVVALVALWIFGGHQASMFIDRFGTIEITSVPIHSVAYEGSGTGGWLTVNDVHLSLNDTNPKIALSIGSTKDNEFAVASGGEGCSSVPAPAPGEERSGAD